MAAREGMTVIAILLFAAVANGEVIDDFEHPIDWQSHPSDGVPLNIVQDPAFYRASKPSLSRSSSSYNRSAGCRSVVAPAKPG
jgi:hypothetical protein